MKDCNDNVLSRMAETPLFSNLPRSVCQTLAAELNVRVKSFVPHEMILHECRSASDIVCVLSGRINVYACGFRDGCRHLVNSLYAGDVHGATFPVLDFKSNPGMLVAAERTTVMLCGVEHVRRLINGNKHPSFIANLYSAASRQGFMAWRKVSLLGCYEIADRILLYLKWRSEEKSPGYVCLSELAAYLGVNRTALYRAIGRLAKNEVTGEFVRAHLKIR